jgi:hypothetical protein
MELGKPDAGNLHVRFDKGGHAAVVGFIASHPVRPSLSTDDDLLEAFRQPARSLPIPARAIQTVEVGGTSVTR